MNSKTKTLVFILSISISNCSTSCGNQTGPSNDTEEEHQADTTSVEEGYDGEIEGRDHTDDEPDSAKRE